VTTRKPDADAAALIARKRASHEASFARMALTTVARDLDLLRPLLATGPFGAAAQRAWEAASVQMLAALESYASAIEALNRLPTTEESHAGGEP
jgi:hypothetical protein